MGWCWEGKCPWLGEALAVAAALSALCQVRWSSSVLCRLCVLWMAGNLLAFSLEAYSKYIKILICGNAQGLQLKKLNVEVLV